MRPYPVHLDDGSLVIEWIHEDCRFCLDIEPNVEESFWAYVRKGDPIVLENGELPQVLIDIFRDAQLWRQQLHPEQGDVYL